MALRAQQGFPGGSAVGAYWLARCEGFRVQAGRHALGTVQQVRTGSRRGEAAALVVRRHRRRIEVPVRRVLEVDPWGETVVVATQRRVPRPLLRPAAASGARGARIVVRGIRRQAPRAGRLARSGRVASRRSLGAAGAWSAPRARRLTDIVSRAVIAAGLSVVVLLAAILGALRTAIAWLAPRVANVSRSGLTAVRRGAVAGRRRLARSRPRHAARGRPSARRPL